MVGDHSPSKLIGTGACGDTAFKDVHCSAAVHKAGDMKSTCYVTACC